MADTPVRADDPTPRDAGLLTQKGRGSATYYDPTDKLLGEAKPPLSPNQDPLSPNLPALSPNLDGLPPELGIYILDSHGT